MLASHLGSLNYFFGILLCLVGAKELAAKDSEKCVPPWIPHPEKYISLKPTTELPQELETVVNYVIPIGFSRDGKLAYLSAEDSEGCESDDGCAFFRFKVSNLKTDAIIQNEVLFQSGGQSAGKPLRPGQIPCEKWKRLTDWLKSLGISPPLSALSLEPVSSFKVRFEEERQTNEGKKTTLFLVSAEKGEKRIGELENPQGSYQPKVLGVLRSPYEESIVIVVGYRSRGWERTQLTQTDIVLFGASLKSGFRKNTPPKSE